MDPSRPSTAHRLVVFDGVCHLCSRSVQFIIERDSESKFRFAPVQSKAGREQLERYAMDPDDVRSFVLIKDDRPFVKSDAAIEIAKELDGGWKLLVLVRAVPRPLRDRVYDFIAERRYILFGKRDRCMTPTDDVRSRFLD